MLPLPFTIKGDLITVSEKIEGYVLVASAAIMWGLSGAVAKVFLTRMWIY